MGQSPPGDTVFDWNGEADFVDGLPFTQGNAEFGAQSPDPIKWCVRPAKIAETGDLLISVRAPVGETNRASQPLAIGRGLAALRFRRADPAFGWHAVNAAKHMLERLAQGSTFDAIGSKELSSLTLLLPPLEEQRAIAAILDSIDEAIERTEEVIAATERLRDALLHDLLTRGLPGRHTEYKQVRGLGTIPASWEVVRLGDVAEVNPRRPKLDVDPRASVTFVPMAAVGEDCIGIISPERREYGDVASGYTYFENDDVLFAKITPCLQNGKHALASEIANGFGFGTTEFHVLRARSRLDPRLLYHLVTRQTILERCQKSFSGTAGQQRIQPEVLRSLLLPLPPLDEQEAIAATLATLDASLEGTNREGNALQDVKASTASSLLSGEVRLQSRRLRS